MDGSCMYRVVFPRIRGKVSRISEIIRTLYTRNQLCSTI